MDRLTDRARNDLKVSKVRETPTQQQHGKEQQNVNPQNADIQVNGQQSDQLPLSEVR